MPADKSATDSLQVRIGTPADVHEIMSLAIAANEENGFVKATPEKMLTEIYASLCLNKGLMGIIGEPGKTAEAAVLLRIGAMWYSAQPVVEEKAIFVRPEFRAAKARRAQRLCNFSKQVADGLGIPLIIGVLSNARTEAKVKLYERQFGKPAGAFFLYGASTIRMTEN